jgi:predicted nucleotidyltransferase
MQNTQITDNTEIMEIIEAIRNTVPVLEIYLFGSHANGTAKEDSDYDFYVVIPDGDLRAIEASRLIRKAMPKQTKPVDMLVGTLSKFNKYKDTISFIEGEVARKGFKLYEQV